MVTAGTIGGMDANTARTENMRRLVAEAGGPAEWLRKYASGRWQQAQVSQWISLANPKGIGGRLARDLEAALGLPRGELDRPPSGQSQSAGSLRDTMAAAVTIARRVQDMAIEPIEGERYVQLLTEAAMMVQEAGAQSLSGASLDDAAREVAARLRSTG
jgi:hypothetical protein